MMTSLVLLLIMSMLNMVFSFTIHSKNRIFVSHLMMKKPTGIPSKQEKPSLKDEGYDKKIRPDPVKALEYFESTSDTTISKILAISLLVVPGILGWWITRPTEMEVAQKETIQEMSYERLTNR
jgi:hypothetical protein